ncbi:hypothetical protein Patl1_21014 [Pistacia atlantica]|uniref:Uncharacterized protein n=1 Tax=Pistacia atlantica TaxID=434234 RepID=A0ACC1BNJ7_9ROSI|nr:hypothetical protein Patl1_21014 [Pistacia atlantica]
MTRRGAGTKGQRLPLLCNHFKVNIAGASGHFYEYSVALFYGDGHPFETKGIGRRVIDKVQETYNKDLAGKYFAYDGEKSLFTFGSLPNNEMAFSVLLDNLSLNRTTRNDSPGCNGSPNDSDRKRRRVSQSKTFKVEISFAAKIPMTAIAAALRGQESENSQEAWVVVFLVAGLSYKFPNHARWIIAKCWFSLKSKVNGDNEGVDITVFDYFVNHRGINLRYSGDLPCINVGRPKWPTYIPVELCMLLALQRYTKALTVSQRSSLVEKSRQKPQEKIKILTEVLKGNKYDSEPMLRSCGISINSHFTQVEGRILSAPRLKAGNGEDVIPRNGRWSFNNKKFVQPAAKIDRWAVVNFSARCDIRSLCRDLAKFGEMKGISISLPVDFLRRTLSFDVHHLLSLEKKNLVEFGIFNQCLSPNRVNEQYLTNLLLKINAKLGGLNSMLAIEQSRSLPLVSKVPTIIFGMDVSHGSLGHSDVPSIAASLKLEMIGSLFKPHPEKGDAGVVRELLLDFYPSSGQVKPPQIIIFRDGVSESQFNQVLNIELELIIKACKFLDESWSPKFTVIVALKNHNTKLFQARSPDNVPPGTVVNNSVCHPTRNDFYICAHAGMMGTTRPSNYHVLLDENGFSVDELQELVHSLCYVYQRSTTAISIGTASCPWRFKCWKLDLKLHLAYVEACIVILAVAPICYAHLAASQVSQFMKFDETLDTSLSHGGLTAPGSSPVPELPVLPNNVWRSMFFC